MTKNEEIVFGPDRTKVVYSTRYNCDMRAFIDTHNQLGCVAFKELYDKDPYYRLKFWEKIDD